MSPPTLSSSMRQFNFVLDADEHRMLTELAEAREVSASEWLRQAIREAHAASGLESESQKIERVLRNVENAQAAFLDRCKKSLERTGRTPTPAVLTEALRDLAKIARSARQEGVEHYAKEYMKTLSTNQEPAKAEKIFDSAFNTLWSLADGWLDLAKAKKL